MKFACFGGAAAVADEAVAVARHRRGKFLFGGKGDKSPARSNSKASSPRTITKRIASPGRRETDFEIYDVMIAAGKSSAPSSVPSSSALSTAASLDSAYSSSSSFSCSSSRSSSSASLSSLLETMPPQPAKRRPQPDEQRMSPAAGAAAVLVCLVMMVFCGRFAATLLTAAVLCFFPRRWPASASDRATAAKSVLARGVPSSPEPVVASRRQPERFNTKAVMDGFLVRNRKNSP